VIFQVGLAEEYGMAGLLFYPDPEDFGFQLPEEMEVRESAVWPVLGDPLSPSHSTIGSLKPSFSYHVNRFFLAFLV
jgi:hypothetical protein